MLELNKAFQIGSLLSNKLNSRAVAAQLLTKVIVEETHIDTLLSEYVAASAAKQSRNIRNSDKPFIQELCFGVLRYYFRLEFIAQQLLKKQFATKDTDIYILVLIGLYQLIYLDTAEFAAVNECVNAAKQLKKIWAANLINAVLRNFLRQKEALLNSVTNNLVANYSHPQWLIDEIQIAWPEYWQTILAANNQKPPLTLRVNQQKTSREEYLKKLLSPVITTTAKQSSPDNTQITIPNTARNDELAKTCLFSQHGIILNKPQTVTALPGFNEGEISVQDEAAQFAATLLELKPGQTVLDCCAAPGGKTCHILETEPSAQLTAVDNNAQRVERIHENLQRLNLTAEVIVDDALQIAKNISLKFDRILLDAPCSAIGVIRRHPEIKILRKKANLKKLAQLQLQLLTALWPLLKPNGIFLYATCSILPQENDDIIEQFLKTHSDAKNIFIDASWGISGKLGRYCLPPVTDGFYYAKLRKV